MADQKHSPFSRRTFLAGTSAAVAATTIAVPSLTWAQEKQSKSKDKLFDISLAQWSLHRAFKGGKLDNLDFAKVTKEKFGIDAVEYVNQFFKDKAEDKKYLAEMKKRCDDLDVKSLLIMCDGEGQLGDPNDAKRTKAVENHYKWVTAAKYLGCHSIRVNAGSRGSYEEQRDRAADGLSRLSEFGAKHEINVIVENHGGLSSNGKWLAEVIEKVDLDNCGTLPDFGNFKTGREKGKDVWYDRYEGVTELMPHAKAVSAKSNKFNESGDEITTDYMKMMRIVLDAGYRGHVGVEWEGGQPGEYEGVKLTKKLLEKCHEVLLPEYKKKEKGEKVKQAGKRSAPAGSGKR